MKHSIWELPITRQARNLALISILFVTAALWSGVADIGVNCDDYQGLAATAPIHSIGDVFRPFVVADPNPSYFRPVSAMTMSVDFLLFGWSGAMYHLTSLLSHLIATLLVFYFVRNIFSFTEYEALLTTLFFGIAASHESNLVVDAMRVDIVLTIFTMTTFLLEERSRERMSWGFRVAAVVSFILALLAKEIAIVTVVLLSPLLWQNTGNIRADAFREWKRLLPFLGAALAVYVYRAYFTHDLFGSQVLLAEGVYSIGAAIRNGAYAIGYSILPLDLESATVIITQYRLLALIVGGVVSLFLLWILRKGNATMFAYWKPFIFMVGTGSVLLLTFERWRVYLPSVGLFAFLVVLITRNTFKHVRTVGLVIAVILGMFHFHRALVAQAEWQTSTALRDRLVESLTRILDSIPQRPLTLGFIVSPDKLGGASVLLPGFEEVIERVEANRISERNKLEGTTDGVQIKSWTAVETFALDTREGFRGLTIKRLGMYRYAVDVSQSRHLILYPSSLSEPGKARRDIELRPGDSITEEGAIVMVGEPYLAGACSMDVQIRDTSAVLVTFDGNSQFTVLH